MLLELKEMTLVESITNYADDAVAKETLVNRDSF